MLRPLVCTFLCLLFYTSAKADTFTLTSGSITLGLNTVSIAASGPNISIGIGVAPGFGSDFANVFCTPEPCAPGSILHVGGFGGLFGDNNFPGVATINGVTFSNIDLAVFLQNNSTTILPANFGGTQGVNLPFSMEGIVSGFGRCPEDPLNPGCRVQVFSITVKGSGIATVSDIVQPHPRVVYNFQPVPEPATLGLLGIGVATLTSFYRSRKKR